MTHPFASPRFALDDYDRRRMQDIARRLDAGEMRPNDAAAMADIFPRLAAHLERTERELSALRDTAHTTKTGD
jgi:hypothetical protein